MASEYRVQKGKLASRVARAGKVSESCPNPVPTPRGPAPVTLRSDLPPRRFLSHPQLKISFSETALETTYQYPSESSVLEELGPEPEAPSAPSPPAAQADDEEEEEELLLQPELQGGLRTKALIVGERRLRRPVVAACWSERALRLRRKGDLNVGASKGLGGDSRPTAPSVQFSLSVMSDSLLPHGLQHARRPCPSQTT